MINLTLKKLFLLFIITILLIPTIYAIDFIPTLIWEKELNSSVSTISISRDGNYLAVGHFDGRIEVFNSTFDLVWRDQTDNLEI